jgi:putrescine transport system substrate-binding protein
VCFPIEAVDAFMQAGSYLGIHPYESEADMDTCAKTLMDVRRYITKFGASTVIQDILSGDVCAAIGMSDNAFKAIQAANKIEKRVRYVHARVMWIDCFGIPKSAPHRKGAHKLIDYLLRPDISARITNSSGILVNNPRSVGLYKDEIRKDEQICPPSWMVERFTLGHVSRNRRDVAIEKRAERVWTDIKARTSHFATVSQRSTLDVEP